jgi:hypothetical protein
MFPLNCSSARRTTVPSYSSEEAVAVQLPAITHLAGMTCDCRSSNYSCSNGSPAATSTIVKSGVYVIGCTSCRGMCSSCYRSSARCTAIPVYLVPADAVADKSTVPESQRCAGTGLIITGIAVTTATTVFWYLMHSQQRLLPHKSSSSIYNRVTKVLPVPNTTPRRTVVPVDSSTAIDWSVVDPSQMLFPVLLVILTIVIWCWGLKWYFPGKTSVFNNISFRLIVSVGSCLKSSPMILICPLLVQLCVHNLH